MLARSTGQEVVVCSVLPDPWVPGIGQDATFRAYADELGDAALEQARKDMPTDVAVQFTTVTARSIASGLVAAAEQYDASMIVVGSAMALIEHLTVSSIADRLLHSSPIPVAIATRGFRAAGGKVKRVTLAFNGGEHGRLQVAAAETLATELSAELRLAAFAVRLAAPAGIRAPLIAHAVLDDWVTHIRAAAEDAVQSDSATAARQPQLAIGQGDDWEEALDDVEWEPGDLLVIGSSEGGPVSRVFLGSRATNIIRNTPVPVIAIPRIAAEELAE
jgi:nucleotide-binding universal stress UspA family protein